MHNNHPQAARHSQGDPAEGVQRPELLIRRFSPAEIQCLSLLQLLLRQRPSALDFPLEESRLQFARWLVEHGRLSEDIDSAREGQPPAEDVSDKVRAQAGAPALSRTRLTDAAAHESPTETTWTSWCDYWHLRLVRVWSALRRSITTLAQLGRE